MVGDPMVGKTAMSTVYAENHFPEENIFQNIPMGKFFYENII
jgi:hypothetical protein